MALLSWRPAVKADRQALSHFTCCEDLRPRTSQEPTYLERHDRWWEYEVRQAIRGLQPPLGPDNVLLVGCSGDDLTAVSMYTQTDGPAQIELDLMAVDISCRGKGKGVADEMMRTTLQHVADRATDASVREVFVSAMVYELNHGSQALCARHGFQHTAMGGPGVQVWGRYLFP